jgi:small subunit ribosomal protein S15
MALSKDKTSEIVKKFGKNEKDSGSIEVQIALLTERINELTKHLKANKKDASGRRGLFILVGQRRGLLDYLNRNDRDSYVKLLASLEIRK